MIFSSYKRYQSVCLFSWKLVSLGSSCWNQDSFIQEFGWNLTQMDSVIGRHKCFVDSVGLSWCLVCSLWGCVFWYNDDYHSYHHDQNQCKDKDFSTHWTGGHVRIGILFSFRISFATLSICSWDLFCTHQSGFNNSFMHFVLCFISSFCLIHFSKFLHFLTLFLILIRHFPIGSVLLLLLVG